MKHSDEIYISAFECYADSGQSYGSVAVNFGITLRTAKVWVLKGSRLWAAKHNLQES